MAKARHASQARHLEDIPNIGPSIADDLRALDIFEPEQLRECDPHELYRLSNLRAGVVQDPCLCDAFIAAVRFMERGPPRPWWYYTPERKAKIGQSY